MYVNNIYFWTIFGMFYIVATLYFTSHMYYMGVISLDCGLFARVSHFFRYLFNLKNFQNICLPFPHISTFIAESTPPSHRCNLTSKPRYPNRFWLTSFITILNWGAATAGVLTTPANFPGFLLTAFVLNSLAYFAYYALMKIFVHKEVEISLGEHR